jgi:hypothetical protein
MDNQFNKSLQEDKLEKNFLPMHVQDTMLNGRPIRLYLESGLSLVIQISLSLLAVICGSFAFKYVDSKTECKNAVVYTSIISASLCIMIPLENENAKLMLKHRPWTQTIWPKFIHLLIFIGLIGTLFYGMFTNSVKEKEQCPELYTVTYLTPVTCVVILGLLQMYLLFKCFKRYCSCCC